MLLADFIGFLSECAPLFGLVLVLTFAFGAVGFVIDMIVRSTR